MSELGVVVVVGLRGGSGRHMFLTSQPSWLCVLVAITRGIIRPDVAVLLMGGELCEKVTESKIPLSGYPIVTHTHPPALHTHMGAYYSNHKKAKHKATIK